MFPRIQYDPCGDWFLLANDERAARNGWSPVPFAVAFHAQPGHPGQPPYGIYVRPEVRVGGGVPNDFQPQAANRPPFRGEWGVLSWTVEGPWLPKENVREGANLLSFLLSFEDRYKAGA